MMRFKDGRNLMYEVVCGGLNRGLESDLGQQGRSCGAEVVGDEQLGV